MVASQDLGWAPGYDVDAVAGAMIAALEEADDRSEVRSQHCAAWAAEHASLRARGLAAARTLLAEVPA